MSRGLILFITFFSVILYSQNSDIDYTKLPFKKTFAKRIDSPPKIDGLINDDVWNLAIVQSDFLQKEPYNLAKPTYKSELRILYDDDFIYVSFNLLDPNPNKLRKPLGRRDDWGSAFGNSSDNIWFGFDTMDDNKNAFSFGVSASNIQLDAQVINSNWDTNWNAVWESEVSINDDGWSVEIKIPFSIFKFNKNKEQIWGLIAGRNLFSFQEAVMWPGEYNGIQNTVESWGVLEGVNNIPQPKNTEFYPYILGGITQADQIESTQNLGLDFKLNVSSNLTSAFTVNPDFGQVEADPSQLNLSAFETRLDEKRPFFVESGNFFKGPQNITHTRRIGQRPGYYETDDEIISQPNATTILGAFKLIGQFENGIQYGMLNAFTDREYARVRSFVDSLEIEKDFLLEPYKNYNMSVVQIPVFNERSITKINVNNLKRENENFITTYSLKNEFSFFSNTLQIQNSLASSLNNEGDNGYAGHVWMKYRDPSWWSISFFAGGKDPNYYVNDMGFNNRNNERGMGGDIELRRDNPSGIFLKQNFKISARRGWSGFSGENIISGNDLDISLRNEFMNYWSFDLDVRMNPKSFDDNDLYRDSRALVIVDEGWTSYQIGFRTDSRKRLVISPGFDYNVYSESGIGYNFKIWMSAKPNDKVNFSAYLNRRLRPNFMEWVDIYDFEDGLYDIVYANSEQWQTNINFRLNVTLSPKMTFESFFQPFYVNMNYLNYNKILQEKTNNLEEVYYVNDQSFQIENYVGTFVFRWEVFSGSFLYVVYNLNNNNYFENIENSWYRSNSNSFFLKYNYFFRS